MKSRPKDSNWLVFCDFKVKRDTRMWHRANSDEHDSIRPKKEWPRIGYSILVAS